MTAGIAFPQRNSINASLFNIEHTVYMRRMVKLTKMIPFQCGLPPTNRIELANSFVVLQLRLRTFYNFLITFYFIFKSAFEFL